MDDLFQHPLALAPAFNALTAPAQWPVYAVKTGTVDHCWLGEMGYRIWLVASGKECGPYL